MLMLVVTNPKLSGTFHVKSTKMSQNYNDLQIFCIRACSSTLYVGLTGIFGTLIQKSTGMVLLFFS